MRRPSSVAFALGNHVARVTLLCSSFAAFMLFVQQHDNRLGGFAVVALFLSRYASVARARVTNYRNWNRSWAQMSDSGTAPAVASKPGRRKSRRGPILFAVWLLLAMWLGSNPEQAGTSAHAAVALGFSVLILWGGVAALIRIGRSLTRRLRGGSRKTSAAEFIVSVVPSIPRRSPSLAQIKAALPAYCKQLMADGSASFDAS